MKEYGELNYSSLLGEYSFHSKQGIKSEKAKFQDDIAYLNSLASIGWRVISKEGNTYFMERDMT